MKAFQPHANVICVIVATSSRITRQFNYAFNKQEYFNVLQPDLA